MNIAVNTRLLLSGKLEGIGWFTYETLKRITRAHPEHHFYFVFDRPYSKEFLFSDNITPVIAHPPARHPLLWYFYFEYGLPKVLRNIKPDLLLSTDGWIPLHTEYKIVNVIHDLNFEHHPEFIKPLTLQYYRRFFKRFAQRADRLATVSEFTKQDIQQCYGISPEKIDVVYNGVNATFSPLTEREKKKIRDKYTEGKPFFLFVGLIHKRKNLVNIFKAFDQFKIQDQMDTRLVLIGEKKWWAGEIEDTYNGLRNKEKLIFMGRKTAEELGLIMGAAQALLYPSLFEGFGIPIIEAFQSETPVLTSNITSMPEVAGNAAYLVDPYSVNQIAEGMECLSLDESYRKILIERGRKQKDKFSWDHTAEALWSTIEKTLFP